MKKSIIFGLILLCKIGMATARMYAARPSSKFTNNLYYKILVLLRNQYMGHLQAALN